MAILDNPGAREDKEGKPFVCGTRCTLQQAVCEAGLKIENLYITYILKCRPIRRYVKATARSICSEYMTRQIANQNPEFVICLGNTAVQWFFGNMEAEVKALRGKLHTIRGISTYVTYHPLAIRRRPNLRQQFNEDWALLAISYLKS